MKRFLIGSSVLILLCISAFALTPPAQSQTTTAPLSAQTQACIACHNVVTPGIVEDWMTSSHAKTTPAQAMEVQGAGRRVSSDNVPNALQAVAVGCYECHSQNPSAHKDNFTHNAFSINVVVSPNDCNTCHATEVNEYGDSKKAHALGNLKQNAVYSALVTTIDSLKEFKDGNLVMGDVSDTTRMETCFACHGTEVTVAGTKTITTKMGQLQVPELTNWPNQGVGRLNPDGSTGACTSCHPRHSFSIEVARKPYTCGQCHLEPDVPGWDVYKESKHGNIVFSQESEVNWNAVPWTVGKDFRAPTCATCHNALVVAPNGDVIAPRTHEFGSRLWVRLFGLIYSHPQPKSGDTSIIKNKDGLPLPTAFSGEPATDFLIDKTEQDRRRATMTGICTGCHGTDWTTAHFAKMDATLGETDRMTAAATNLLAKAWGEGLADNKNPFDEAIEQKWIAQWLFYANSTRYASAMPGAQDYATFKHGWWDMTANLAEMQEWLNKAKK